MLLPFTLPLPAPHLRPSFPISQLKKTFKDRVRTTFSRHKALINALINALLAAERVVHTDVECWKANVLATQRYRKNENDEYGQPRWREFLFETRDHYGRNSATNSDNINYLPAIHLAWMELMVRSDI